ncbi:MAG: glycerol-3-phosphate dehydrogenase/oxidase [Anaerolineales bacterium]|nr:glycerol-3-phosphate dehydrogenase/oxidase [Anaerolineales bacterium]
MWTQGWRDRVWATLSQTWDLIVIGGGITGAGILREAANVGLRALLVEAGDFASGTSSRSSKLVHGGLRYLKQGELRLTFESVRERERLLREGRGLIQQLGFLVPNFAGDRPPAWVFGLGLAFYDALALQWSHRRYDAVDMRDLCPALAERGLLGGYRFFDAITDDARLVLRLLREAVRAGGVALNYARAEGLLRDRAGQVRGVVLRDRADPAGRMLEVQARAVINASGAWADDLRAHLGARRRLRHLRGSHLIFPASRFPLRRAVSFLHPRDHRPVFALPWEGVTLFGTTDVDHGRALETDPAISPAESEYLLEALQYAFPALDLRAGDVQATLAGVRAVVDTGKADPSKESREHVLWNEDGLVTVTGGKLTTFRLMAHAALRAVRAPVGGKTQRVLDPPPTLAADLRPEVALRLAGRYGADAPALIAAAQPGELAPVADSVALWAELRWAARAEGVVHLDDLLLRRVRLGLLLPEGGLPHLDRIRAIVQPELGWDDARWEQEAADYARLWQASYAPPG